MLTVNGGNPHDKIAVDEGGVEGGGSPASDLLSTDLPYLVGFEERDLSAHYLQPSSPSAAETLCP